MFLNVCVYYDDTTPPLELHSAFNLLRRHNIPYSPFRYNDAASRLQAAASINSTFGPQMISRGIPLFTTSITTVAVTYRTTLNSTEQIAVGLQEIESIFGKK